MHAALAYYHANREEIGRTMTEDELAGDRAETDHESLRIELHATIHTRIPKAREEYRTSESVVKFDNKC